MDVILSWRRTDDDRQSEPREIALSSPRRYRLGRATDCDIVLDDEFVSRHHIEIDASESGITLSDPGSGNGSFLDGNRITRTIWQPGQVLIIGPFELSIRQVGQESVLLETPPAPELQESDFPGRLFDGAILSASAIKASGHLAGEVTYLAVGGGIGSFVWVDHLRTFGVPAAAIRVLGIAADRKPYSKYQRLCRNSQIPDHERIRSNSISAPDNVWGFPGYASRECWRELKRGNLGGLKYIWQVFAEPTFADSYTPRAGDVWRSFDQEAARIGWHSMWIHGQCLRIRKTDDERYAVAYRLPRESAGAGKREQIIIARHLQIATGYPASNFLPDLQEFRAAHPGTATVVNAYEQHDQIYANLERSGGTVLIRGRGIVASRVIQRLGEAHAKNPAIRMIHLMRGPVAAGSRFGWTRRAAIHNVEHQPFNWPKSCWGGALRKKIEKATPEERQKLFPVLGGTSTAFRKDWHRLIDDGLAGGWYEQRFGNVTAMQLRDSKILSEIETHKESGGKSGTIEADYVIDCTGLIANLEAMPLLKDLIQTYALPRNKVGSNGAELRMSGIEVTNSFEIASLRNGRGSVHAAGVVTANGPYAAVDSFLGLQFAALRSVDNLFARGAAGITSMGPVRSVRQWIRWCRGAAP